MSKQAGVKVQDHYSSDDIAARILAALRSAQSDDAGPVTPEVLAPLDHFLAGALRPPHEMVVSHLRPEPGDRLLDLGGGIGGQPAGLRRVGSMVPHLI